MLALTYRTTKTTFKRTNSCGVAVGHGSLASPTLYYIIPLLFNFALKLFRFCIVFKDFVVQVSSEKYLHPFNTSSVNLFYKTYTLT